MFDKITENHHLAAALIAVITSVSSGSLLLGATVYVLVMVAFLAHYSGKLPVVIAHIRTWWINRQGTPANFKKYDIIMGYDENGRPQLENLKSLGHAFVVATTGFGKTVWYQGMLHWLIETHTPEELQIYISDAKKVSFPIWSRIPHLAAPIAVTKDETDRMIDMLLAEMERRTVLFKLYSSTRLCDNIEKYYEITGDKLPRIVVIFDEKTDAIESDSDTDEKLITLAKLSRSYGFNIFVGTQRPSAKSVNGELISQLVTKVAGYMPSAREYGVVTQLPKELYSRMTPTPGRFMVYTTRGQWRFLQSRMVPDSELEKRAARVSRGHTRPRWGTPIASRKNALAETTKLTGTMAEKTAVVQAWANTLDEKPNIQQIAGRYGVTRPTAKGYHGRLNK